MRIVVITPWHSEKMGYSDNFLPVALGKLGHEVYLVSSNAQVYYNLQFYKQTYEPYLGPPLTDCKEVKYEFFTLIRLPLKTNKFGLQIQDLEKCITNLNPDIVQTYEIDFNISFQMALLSYKIPFKLFTANHLHKSVFAINKRFKSIKDFLTTNIRNKIIYLIINSRTKLHYPISHDSAQISIEHFNVPKRKIRIDPLGTDIELFKPISTEKENQKRINLREKLGFLETDIVCIYTGRITTGKKPEILAKAINHLHNKGYKQYKGLFVGIGDLELLQQIKQFDSCKVHDFVPTIDLPSFYQAADIAVWPSQESTSQLDAIACGLPLILNDTIEVTERIEGNGLLFKFNNYEDLADKLLILNNAETRRLLGEMGRTKAVDVFSWDIIAKNRIKDYSL